MRLWPSNVDATDRAHKGLGWTATAATKLEVGSRVDPTQTTVNSWLVTGLAAPVDADPKEPVNAQLDALRSGNGHKPVEKHVVEVPLLAVARHFSKAIKLGNAETEPPVTL